MITRIEPVESWGKFVLDIKIGDKWIPFHVDYRPILEKMAKLIEDSNKELKVQP